MKHEKEQPVQHIGNGVIEFTTGAEITAHRHFNEALDRDLDVITSARLALQAGLSEDARYSAEFVEYLSDDTLVITQGGEIVLTAKGREAIANSKGA